MQSRLRAAGIAAGFATALFWGLSFLAIKVSVAVIPPMSLGFLRFSAASLILMGLKRLLAPADRLGRADILPVAGAGLTGVSLYFFMENNGVLLTTASEASIIVGAVPVLSLLADRLFLGARLGPRQYLGAGLSSLGVWLTVAESLRGQGAAQLPPPRVGSAAAILEAFPGLAPKALGFIFMGGSVLCWIAYSLLSPPLFRRHERISVVFWQSVAGTLGFIPFALMEAPSWSLPSPTVWLNVAFLAVFCSALAYWLYALSLQSLGMTAASVFINLIPGISALAAFLLLGERLSALQWLGLGIVLAGVFLATAARLRFRTPRPSSSRPSSGPPAP